MTTKLEEIFMCAILLLISLYIEYRPELSTILINDFRNPNFLFGIFLVIIFSVYILSKNYETKRREKILESLKNLFSISSMFGTFWFNF